MSGKLSKQRRILGFLFVLSIITYLDRVNISIVSPAIEREFSFDHVHLGTIFSAFVVGYMLFQIPSGWLGDRIGHKRSLTIILLWWSVATGLTAYVSSTPLFYLFGTFATLWIIRFLVGMGEAGAYPCANGIIGDWFGNYDRAGAAGLMFAGIGVGSAISPPCIAWVMTHWGWRSAFQLSAGLGIVLAFGLHVWMPERPPINAASLPESECVRTGMEKDLYQPKPPEKENTPWKKLLRNFQLWMLVTSIFFFSYVTYVYYFWFYPYLVDIRKISVLRSSLFAAMPFLMMALSAPAGGWLIDRLVTRVGKTLARRRVAGGGLIAAAMLIPTGATIPNAYLAIACLSLGAGSLYLAISAYFATALDVLPGYSATVSGTMNTGASLGGIIAPILTPWIATHYGWVPALGLAGLFALFAATLWKFIAPE